MRTRLAMLAAATVLVVLLAAARAPARTSQRMPRWLLPNAVTFLDQSHGVLGTGDAPRYGGAIELSSDGGQTWNVVRRTARPVVALTQSAGFVYARFDDGETLRSHDGGRTWRPTSSLVWSPAESVCPMGDSIGTNAGDWSWSLCTTQPGAGNQGKAVYRDLDRGWTRVACTNFADGHFPCRQRERGGISSYGYPAGIAGTTGNFAIIWPGARGIVYVTRDGGHHWHGAPVVESDVDSGRWATAVGDTGFVLIWRGGNLRLVGTTNAGRTWRVVHRWR